jgi:hypothetical protein
MSLKSTISKKVSVNLQTLRGQYPGTTTSFRHVDGDALSTARAQYPTDLQQQAAAAFRVGGGGAIITTDVNNNDITTPNTISNNGGAGSDGSVGVNGFYQRMAVPTNVSKWTGAAGGMPNAVAPDQRIPVDISLVLPGPQEPNMGEFNGVDRQVVTLKPTTPANVNRLDPAKHYITVVPMVCATFDTQGAAEANRNASVSAGERAQVQPTVNINTANAATTAANITMERMCGNFGATQLPFCNYILQVKNRPPTYLF